MKKQKGNIVVSLIMIAAVIAGLAAIIQACTCEVDPASIPAESTIGGVSK
ncbi:hypothetical protein [Methylobacillus sp.]|nr:hypothetical protein [Methylobacillus sp.]